MYINNNNAISIYKIIIYIRVNAKRQSRAEAKEEVAQMEAERRSAAINA